MDDHNLLTLQLSMYLTRHSHFRQLRFTKKMINFDLSFGFRKVKLTYFMAIMCLHKKDLIDLILDITVTAIVTYVSMRFAQNYSFYSDCYSCSVMMY